MATTATWATQNNDAALLQHVHVWGDIQHETPPAYLLSADGPSALADVDRRFRPCTGRGCLVRVWGSDVEHPDVLAACQTRAMPIA